MQVGVKYIYNLNITNDTPNFFINAAFFIKMLMIHNTQTLEET